MNLKNKLIPTLTTGMLIILTFSDIASAQSKNNNEKHNLMNFAYANCMFWYFKSKNYDLKDIRAISGGYVEMGQSSADKYQEMSLYIKTYTSSRKTKQNIDPQLLKCFHLKQNDGLLNIINN